MAVKQGTSPKTKNTHTPRGIKPGDKVVARHKRTGGAVHIAQGQDLLTAITRPRTATTSSHNDNGAHEFRRRQVGIAYKSLGLESGSYEAAVSAKFIDAWLKAEPVTENGVKKSTRTGLARQAVLDGLPAEQARSRQVKDILSNVVEAIISAYDTAKAN